ATPDQWLDAAEALVQPNDVRGRGGAYMIPHRPGGKVPPSRGEPLRSRANPSIAELMARRARQLDPPEEGNRSVFDIEKANRMAEFLAAWDPRGALPVLRDRVARSAAVLGQELRDNPSSLQGMDAAIARLTLLRVRGGDVAALDDYAARIRKVSPPDYDFFATEMFEPMWRYPDHPAI